MSDELYEQNSAFNLVVNMLGNSLQQAQGKPERIYESLDGLTPDEQFNLIRETEESLNDMILLLDRYLHYGSLPQLMAVENDFYTRSLVSRHYPDLMKDVLMYAQIQKDTAIPKNYSDPVAEVSEEEALKEDRPGEETEDDECKNEEEEESFLQTSWRDADDVPDEEPSYEQVLVPVTINKTRAHEVLAELETLMDIGVKHWIGICGHEAAWYELHALQATSLYVQSIAEEIREIIASPGDEFNPEIIRPVSDLPFPERCHPSAPVPQKNP